MEALKVNKFGRTYRTGTQAAQAIVVRSYFFLIFIRTGVQLVKHDIVTAVVYWYNVILAARKASCRAASAFWTRSKLV